MKFPPHVTDILQPLDKHCFGPLKRKCEDKLNARINEFGLTKKADKAEFVDLISSIWHFGMKESNVIAGFETTGIWPLNKEKYQKSRFDIRLFEKYQKWVESGKPESDWASYTNTAQEPSTVDFKNLNESNISLDKSAIKKNQSSSHQSSTSHQSEENNYLQDDLNVLGPYPFDCPSGFKWVPAGWKLEPIQIQSNENGMNTSQANNVQNTSFEELFLDKIKPLKKSPQKKCHKINLSSAVISNTKLLQQLEDKESEKEKGRNLRKKKGAKPTKKVDVSENSSSEEESEHEDDDDEDDNDDCEFTNIQEPKDITDAQKILHSTWKSLAPPAKEDNLKECCCAVIYIDPKNNKKMFVGRVLQRWLHDEQGSVQAITFDFLKNNTTNIDDSIYEKFDKDGTEADIIPIHQIIAGPLNVISIPSTSYQSKRKVKIPDNRAIHKLYCHVSKILLEDEYNRYLCLPESDEA